VPESCGGTSASDFNYALVAGRLTDRLVYALAGAACQWKETAFGCRDEPSAAPPRREWARLSGGP